MTFNVFNSSYYAILKKFGIVHFVFIMSFFFFFSVCAKVTPVVVSNVTQEWEEYLEIYQLIEKITAVEKGNMKIYEANK